MNYISILDEERQKKNFSSKEVFFAPSIPEKKVYNVIDAYANNLKPDQILLLLDDTLWGGAKESMILSEIGVHAHELFQDPNFFPIDKIEKIHSIGRKVFINGEIFFSANQIGKPELGRLCDLIQSYIERASENKVFNINADDESDLKAFNTIISDNEYYIYNIKKTVEGKNRIKCIKTNISTFIDKKITKNIKYEPFINKKNTFVLELYNDHPKQMAESISCIIALCIDFATRNIDTEHSEPSVEALLARDAVLHELIVFSLMRGVQMIFDSFEGEEASLVARVYAGVIADGILLPFYESKMAGTGTLTKLQIAAGKRPDAQPILDEILKIRKTFSETKVNGGADPNITLFLITQNFYIGQARFTSEKLEEKIGTQEINPYITSELIEDALSILGNNYIEDINFLENGIENILIKLTKT